MDKFILAFAGGMGSGKSNLTRELANRLGWKRASFGEHVKKIAGEAGRDASDRGVLQQLGQALVLTQLEKFVRDVLAQAEGDANVILDGVRHVEVYMQLKELEKENTRLRLVYIKTPTEIRQDHVVKRDKVERRLVASYDSDITEAQIPRIIPQYADKIIDGTLPVSILVDQLVDYAREETGKSLAAA